MTTVPDAPPTAGTGLTPGPTPPDSSHGTSRSDGLAFARRALGTRGMQSTVSLLAFLVLFVGYVVWLGDTFANAEARMLDVHQNAAILVLALAALVTLIPGMFDLSIASMATLTTFLTIGLRTKEDLPFLVIVLACLGVGLAGGLLNGFLVERLGVNTFIATLGTGGIFLGASSVYSAGAQIAPVLDGPTLPKWFLDAGLFTQKCPEWLLVLFVIGLAAGVFAWASRFAPRGWSKRTWIAVRVVAIAVVAAVLILLDVRSWLDAVSVLVTALVAMTFALWVLLQQTSYGRHLRAVGSNRTAATLAGVPVERTVIQAFALGGVLAAVSGLVLGATQSVAVPNVAVSFLLPAFAAAFLSTVVLSNGQFTVWGTLIGGVFLVWVSQGLILGGLAPTWSGIVNGAVLIVAVALSSVLRRRRAG